MIIMALLFIIQLSVSIGAIAVSHEQQSKLMEAGWSRMTNKMKSDIQDAKNCCGYKNETSPNDPKMGHPTCKDVSTITVLLQFQSQTVYGVFSPIFNWVRVLEETTFLSLI